MLTTKHKYINFSSVFFAVCIVIIVLWPLINSFLGLDMVDTGYYLYQYDTPLSEYGVYTTYFATLIGAVWLKIFPGLGMWGLNVLEILIEWLCCFCVYQSFKGRFGKKTTILGIVISMIGISTYVNIFNYHQLNMVLCCLMLCLMHYALTYNKNRYLFFAGCAGALAITSRMPSVLTLVCILCILYSEVLQKKGCRAIGRKAAAFLSGYGVIGIIVYLFLVKTGLLEVIWGEVFRLNDLGNTSSTTYGTASMIKNFFIDIWQGGIAALLLLIIMVAFMLFIQFIDLKCVRNNSVGRALFIIVGIALLPLIYFAVYVVGQAPPFVQLTSFSWFLYGACFLLAVYYIIKGLVIRKKAEVEDGMIAMMGIALILLCTVGSAARAKHVILGLWIIVPFYGNKLKEVYRRSDDLVVKIFKEQKVLKVSKNVLKKTIGYLMAVSLVCFLIFVSVTNNFDSPNRLELTSQVSSSKLKYIRTTEREADAVNMVLEVMKDKDDYPLMVVGNAVIFYYLTGMDSYVKPWVSGSSYTYEQFDAQLTAHAQDKEKKPVIIKCKTDPYRGFSESNYKELIERENANNYNGKKVLVEEFMSFYSYRKIAENDYFEIYEADSTKETQPWSR